MPGKGNRLLFSKEQDEKLIEEVSKHPALYDLKNSNYKNQNVRDNIWVEISKKIDKGGKFITIIIECKTRWKSIKDVYMKKKKEGKLGTGSGKIFVNKWEHMDTLMFLVEATVSRKTTSNITEDNEFEDRNSPDVDNNDNLNDTALRDSGQREKESQNINDENDNPAEVLQQSQSSQPENAGGMNSRSAVVNKRKTTHDKILFEINKRAKDRHEVLKSIENSMQSKPENRHPIKTFFDSMAETVMNFSPVLQVQAKTGVLKVIAELELENIRASTRVSTSSSFTPSFFESSNSAYECSVQPQTATAQELLTRPPSTSNPQFSLSCAEYFSNYDNLI